ncbi:NADH dehydrogenase [ubiquinone] 1 alpha subcomplex assembly factor 2 [Anthophora retusa]
MSGKGRSVLQMIFRDFVASIKFGSTKTKLIGEDYYGTKYYETPIPKGSAKKLPTRYFEPINKTDFEQELPAEWEAWLRHRRKVPPTKEELERNHQIQLIKKQNARQIKEIYSSSETEVTKLATQTKQQSSFPTYEEYKNEGRDYQIKIPKKE